MENDKQPSKNITATILKWVGVAAAIVSLILGVNQVNNLWTARQQRELRDKKIVSLIRDSRTQADADDFETGWKTLEQAHSLNADSRMVQNEQAAFAMKWLRQLIFINTTGKYSDVTARLLPVLYHAANDTTGRAAADIMAHIGWANFLKWREDGSNLKIRELYEDAVKKDSVNIYAHAMWGFWLMKQNNNMQLIKDAAGHFTLALHDGRDTAFARLIQLWAFQQNSYPPFQAELFDVINNMRINNETLPPDMNERIVDHAYSYYSQDAMEAISKRLSPADHLQTFLYLTKGMDLTDHPYRTFMLASLTEKAGDLTKALAIYEAMSADSALEKYTWHGDIGKAIERIKQE